MNTCKNDCKSIRACKTKTACVFIGPNASGAEVCIHLLNKKLDKLQCQEIARNSAIPTSTFLWPDRLSGRYQIRWFNPVNQIRRCGIGALAACALLAQESGSKQGLTIFIGIDGLEWHASWYEDVFTLCMALTPMHVCCVDQRLASLCQVNILRQWQSQGEQGYIAIQVDGECNLKNVQPDLKALAKKYTRALLIFQVLEKSRMAFRYFAPQYGIDEDPATGSVASVLASIADELSLDSELVMHQKSAPGAYMTMQREAQQLRLNALAQIVKK